MADPKKPFEGATHQLIGAEEFVKAVCWKKDGDHPGVVRYPIERREFKGLLVVSEKERFALRFGDWILEDQAGRVWIASPEAFAASYKVVGANAASA